MPNPESALRLELEKTLHVKAHTEMRETDVLLLKIKNANAPELRTGKGFGGGIRSEQRKITWNNSTFGSLAGNMEWHFGMPILDRTGTVTKYDMTLHWADKSKEAIKQALFEQLGLELVPSQEKIEMLVVEKTN